MSKPIKKQSEMLAKLGISTLNPMQEEAQLAISSVPDVILLSPTGSGKTIAYLLPLIEQMDHESSAVQALVLVPTRELAIQIEQVCRELGSGFKCNAVYGGRSIKKDMIELAHPPALLIGTPGRVADHFRRETFDTRGITFLVLDEFDKSLEIGFEDDMREILFALRNLEKRVLTSATEKLNIPDFVGIRDPLIIDHTDAIQPDLTLKRIVSYQKDKLETLAESLLKLGGRQGIIFCNFKESIDRISEYLDHRGIQHGLFHGSMEQQDRERSLIQFRNGTFNILLSTDLAARGIDVPEIAYILHYHLPPRIQEFTHRNGRTARMKSDGTAYILHWKEDELPDYLPRCEEEEWKEMEDVGDASWKTLFVSGGRKDKISKGDIAGFFFKQGGLKKDELGQIELKTDCAFVAVPAGKAEALIAELNNEKIKGRKLRIYEV